MTFWESLGNKLKRKKQIWAKKYFWGVMDPPLIKILALKVFSRIIVLLASGTTFLTQTHSLCHRKMPDGPHFYIMLSSYE